MLIDEYICVYLHVKKDQGFEEIIEDTKIEQGRRRNKGIVIREQA